MFLPYEGYRVQRVTKEVFEFQFAVLNCTIVLRPSEHLVNTQWTPIEHLVNT